MKTQAVLFAGVDQIEVGQAVIPAPGVGEVIVETHFSCISPGTELRSLAGQQAGSGPFPFVPGYQLSGVIVETGAGVTLAVGTRVCCNGTERISDRGRCWGGHISHAVVRESAVLPVPGGVDLLDASMVKLAAIAYHGLRVSRPGPNEKVAVVGLGPLGQLSARLHAMTGAHVVVADVSAQRVAFARQSGLDARLVEGSLLNTFREVFPDGADLVVDVTGSARVLPQSMELVRVKPWDDSPESGGRLLLQGSYPADFTLDYQECFRRELSLLLTRDQQPRDSRNVLDLLARGKLRIRDIITGLRPVAKAPDTYAELRAAKEELLTVAFDWRRA
ncbi:MAG: zinc-binding alcohol dehydrogenase [Opitutaceae bacterium]